MYETDSNDAIKLWREYLVLRKIVAADNDGKSSHARRSVPIAYTG